jgi:hypothetical protein
MSAEPLRNWIGGQKLRCVNANALPRRQLLSSGTRLNATRPDRSASILLPSQIGISIARTRTLVRQWWRSANRIQIHRRVWPRYRTHEARGRGIFAWGNGIVKIGEVYTAGGDYPPTLCCTRAVINGVSARRPPIGLCRTARCARTHRRNLAAQLRKLEEHGHVRIIKGYLGKRTRLSLPQLEATPPARSKLCSTSHSR